MKEVTMRLLVLLSIFAMVYSAPEEDRITYLPGLSGELTSAHYSGYLQAAEERFHFYWFVESQSNPETDPLILWLNGGPGCSSLLGFFTELGPYTINDDSLELEENIYAWNTVANVIFMESPVCVGFSYETGDNQIPCRNGDITTAEQNYEALKDFFAKFPEYLNHEFYIIGESYAGIYIPTLSIHVVDNQDEFPINFKGFGLGNAVTNYDSLDNSLMFFVNYRAMLDKGLWKRMVEECCPGGEGQFNCNFSDPQTEACADEVNVALDVVYNSGINIYNAIADCQGIPPSSNSRSQYDADRENLFRKYKSYGTARSDPPCLDYTTERTYLNTQEVRDALHVASEAGIWSVCDTVVGVAYQRDFFDMVEEIEYLLTHVRGLIYSGDTDLAVNVMGNEWDIISMGLNVTVPARTWVVNEQVAGFYHGFENLDFVTFRGSGHMVPEDKPPEALHMLIRFLNEEPY